MFHFTIDVFYAMNPSIGKQCGGLVIGTNYCLSNYPGGLPRGIQSSTSASPTTTPPPTTTKPPVSSGTSVSTPSPVQTGITLKCIEFYKVVKDDTCYDIAQNFKVDLAKWYTWNPSVKDDCSGLEANVYVCVAIK